MAKGKLSFEQQKAKFLELSNDSVRKIVKNENTEFLNHLQNELRAYIDKGTSFSTIANNFNAVFGKKMSALMVRQYCIDKKLYTPKKREKRKKNITPDSPNISKDNSENKNNAKNTAFEKVASLWKSYRNKK